jgi:hypothetical protein
MTEFSSVAIQRAFKAMSDEATSNKPKESSNNLCDLPICRSEISLTTASKLVEVVQPLELHEGSRVVSKSSKTGETFIRIRFVKSFQAAAQHSNFGEEKNLAQTGTEQFPAVVWQ